MAEQDENGGGPVGYMILPKPGLEVTVGSPQDRPLPVFGADAELVEGDSVLMPDPRMTLGHFVVFPKGFATRVSEEEKMAFANKKRTKAEEEAQANNQGVIVGRITKNREPQKAVEYREGKFVVPSYIGDGGDVASGQAKFYVASHQLRDWFIEFSKVTMSVLDKELQKMATLVTIVDSAIHARPLNAERGSSLERFEERGFEVVAEFRQFVTLGMPRTEIAEFRIYSEHGEYPVHVPKDVEMGMLLRMDGMVMADPDIKHDMSRQERAARLLAKLKGV